MRMPTPLWLRTGVGAISFIGNLIGDVAGGILGTKQQAKAAQAGAQTLAQGADKGIAAVQQYTDQAQGFQTPYLDAGNRAIGQQLALLGLGGSGDQQTAINGILASPDYTSAVRQGEEAILANASATGGLRGGNVQDSLANFRADQFGNAYQRYFSNLGDLTQTGQNAANTSAGLAGAAGGSISNLLLQQANALAGGQIAKGALTANTINAGAQLAKAVAAF